MMIPMKIHYLSMLKKIDKRIKVINNKKVLEQGYQETRV